MSFLDQILKQKRKLIDTETVVTQADGTQYIHSKMGIMHIGTTKCGYVIDTKPDQIPVCVIDYLFIGSQDCCERDVLTKYNIKVVISIGIHAPVQYDDVNYKFVECLDLPETNLSVILIECVDFINDAITKKNNILVHCNAGVSRSASIVIGYLITQFHMSYADAYELVKSVRNCIRPNDGFVKQLKALI